jgi:YVTN family beta-propeller protein
MRTMRTRTRLNPFSYGIAASVLALATQARADQRARWSDLPQQLPTGQYIAPTAARGATQQSLDPGLPAYPDFVAGMAVRSQLSPDGNTLAVLCAGQNSLLAPDGTPDTDNSTQYIFIYDVRGKHKPSPKLTQVIKQTNSYVGLVFAPDGSTLYATGGRDDAVYAYKQNGGSWALARTIALGHNDTGIGVGVSPNAAGLGISADGRTLVVANNYNDSISVIDTESGSVRYEHDLRPYFPGNEGKAGGVGGTFPFAVVIQGNDIAYVSSVRDREVDVIDISSKVEGRLIKRIRLDGNGLGMTLDKSGSRLFVAQDNADQVAVIDTSKNTVVAEIDARAPEGLLAEDPESGHHRAGRGTGRARYTGVGTFAVTLSPDGKALYAVNAGANSVAVIDLSKHGYKVIGLIPTAYEPHDISFSADGSRMYIVNGKSVTGPNPQQLADATALITSITYPGGNAAAATAAVASNQYQFQLERASLVSAPVPNRRELERLTETVALNNFYSRGTEQGRKVMAFLRQRIKHVIYVIKENRTFDQILGDLDNGADADPTLVQFGETITPSHHRLARQFVTLDNFMDAGDGSMDGWSWGMQARVTNTESLTQQINYAAVDRGLSYESEGTNRNVPVNFSTIADRDSAVGPAGTADYSASTAGLPGGTENVLAGTADHAQADAPFGIEDGYIFSAVLQAGGTVRNYGWLENNIGRIGTKDAPIIDPFATGEVQVAVLLPPLVPFTDVYYRYYDQSYPDLWRHKEWKREFDQFVEHGNLPSLSMVALGHDHMGSFGSALGGFDTPETQQADNDLALGLLVQTVAESRYAEDTLIIITEDDTQDGPDHVDSHRATTYVAGPYVRTGAVISTAYSQVNVLRTIEDVLGTQHINLNTAYQEPMSDVFDIRASGRWSFTAEASTVLQPAQLAQAGLQGVKYAAGEKVKSKHDAQYWEKATAGYDFSGPDRVSPGKFNRVIWKGLMGDKPYPVRHRLDATRTATREKGTTR